MARQPRVDSAWENLAGLLVKRRIALDPKYRNRRAFCEDKQLDYRVISDIEGARRDNFSGPMLTAIEVAYEIADGAIKQALAHPDLTELPPRTRLADGATYPAEPLTVHVPPNVSLANLAPWEQHIWLTPDLTVEHRESAILLVRLLRGDLEDDTGGLLRLSHAINQLLARRLDREHHDPPRAV